MIHIDPQVGLKCVNDPSHPGKFQFCHMPFPWASLGRFIFIYFFTPLSRSQSSEYLQICMKNIESLFSWH